MKRKRDGEATNSDTVQGVIVRKEEDKINFHAGHRNRVRERFVKEGLDHFHDHQVLELLLFYAQPYKDVNELAHRLLHKFGSLSSVFEAEVADLMEVKGVGYNTAVLLSMMPSLVNRYQMDKWRDKEDLSDTGKMGKYAVALFSGRVNEAFYVICLNVHNKVHSVELVAEGGVNEVVIHPRMLVEVILRSKCKSVVLTHNHPGGSKKPSSNDIELTERVMAILKSVAVKVVDHIVVSNGEYFSFAEKGFMKIPPTL